MDSILPSCIEGDDAFTVGSLYYHIEYFHFQNKKMVAHYINTKSKIDRITTMNEDSINLLKECNSGCKSATNSMGQVMRKRWVRL